MANHIGLFGGSFNPVHRGHLLVAQSVFQQLELDELRFIPAAQSPFKNRPQIDDAHRLAMLELVTKPLAEFGVDPQELDRPGPSYTIDTLQNIAREQQKDHLYLLIGIDAWLVFEQWRDWQSIVDLCRLVVMTRPAYAWPELSEYWQARQVSNAAQLTSGKLLLLEVPASDAASSEIRRTLRKGKDASEFLNPAVANYINEHQLYR